MKDEYTHDTDTPMSDTTTPDAFAAVYTSHYASWWSAAVRLSAATDEPRAQAERLVYAATRALLTVCGDRAVFEDLDAREIDEAFREVMVEHAARRSMRGVR